MNTHTILFFKKPQKIKGHKETFKAILYQTPIKLKVYYRNRVVDALTGKETKLKESEVCDFLKNYSLSHTYDRPIVFHFFYEFGFLWNGLEEKIKTTDILAIEIEYKDFRPFSNLDGEVGDVSFHELERIDESDYKIAFQKGYEKLLSGDCYQFNLTYKNKLKISGGIKNLEKLFIKSLLSNDQRGNYAHISHIPFLNLLILSNSPECLFEVQKDRVISAPIKGTISLKDPKNLKKAWVKLRGSKKDRGELDMITDLIRNDLSKIDRPNAKVLSQASPLLVPGILHQYSLIEAIVAGKTSLFELIYALFPGGSITGAPKKRSMQILKDLELESREIYCGSTCVMHQETKMASINIRTAQVCTQAKSLEYGSGGGVTLLSNDSEEYSETKAKFNSFLYLLGLGK